jgi:hypothetical protein
MLSCLILLLPQSPVVPPGATTPRGNQGQPAAQKLGVEFDKNGWPVQVGKVQKEAGNVRDGTGNPKPAEPMPVEAGNPAPVDPPGPAGETAAFGSPWLRVWSSVGSAETFQALGCLRIQWRMRVVAADGTTLGERTVWQTTDSGAAGRERLEFEDGRIYTRLLDAVQAERHGMPWPTLEAAAERDIQLFSLQAGLPWRLADPTGFVEGAAPRTSSKDGSVTFTRSPRTEKGRLAGVVDASSENIELVVDAATGVPREVVTAAGSAEGKRRVRFDDWRAWNGLSVPYRRTWLDAEGRPATVLELVQIEAGIRATDKEFRLR